MDKKTYRYEFVVDGLDHRQADLLMADILKTAEMVGARVYGGFIESDGEAPEKEGGDGDK